MTRNGLAVACVFLLALTTMPSVRALPKFQPPTSLVDLEGRVIDCPDFMDPQVELVPYTFLVGYPIVGFTVKVSAENVKFHGRALPACGFPDFVAALPAFSWSAKQPDGTAAVLLDASFPSLTPRLPVGQVGTYHVQLTVCPGGCTVLSPGNHPVPVHVDEQVLDIPIEARESAPLAPETTPFVPIPDHDAGHTTPVDQCAWDGLPGSLAKQWWAVKQINGPDQYRQLDGFVRESRVARMDDPLNHGWPGPVIQDANFNVVPDLPYTDLLFKEFNPDSPQDIEVEWESRSMPERYRPTPGDRVSIFGYWDTDCGHDRPEIHPPVGIAVHRPRPLRIPDDAIFTELGGQRAGQGIYVPGIITDIFFSVDGGDLLGADTGLANHDLVPGPTGSPEPAPVPAPSLDHVFQFDIYLPRNPQATMQQMGVDTPPVPLYLQRDTVTGGPVPQIEFKPDPPAITSYLHVTIDLRGYTGQSYGYRIAAGWVLPSADNWGLAGYKLRLRRLEVLDDGDGAARGDGDWRLWVNTNNASNDSFTPQEWVKVINYDVDNGIEDFSGRPWETGRLGEPGEPLADRWLGPDLLRYPAATSPFPAPRDYGILFHSTGYEADSLTDDDAGTVLEAHVPRGTTTTSQNQCETTGEHFGGLTYSGCVRYNAVYETVARPPLAPAVLSRAMQGIAAQYVLSCRSPLCKIGPLDAIIAAPLEAPAVDPLDAHLAPGDAAREFTDFAPFEPADEEPTSLTTITAGNFYRDVVEAQKVDPAKLDRRLKALHGFFLDRIADRDLGREALLDAQVLRASLPADLWAKYFSDVPVPRPERGSSRARFVGGGYVETGRERVQLGPIKIHCDAVRLPNSLPLVWGSNRFDLDLMLESACADQPGPAGEIHTQKGAGLGRLNGVPGASIRWTLVDGGRTGDAVSITVWSGDGKATVLEASGAIKQGRIIVFGRISRGTIASR
jgi:hypothetical protein